MIRSVCSLILFLSNAFLFAQNAAFVNPPAKTPKILRIHYQNDLFAHTDYYFTQGEHIEFIKPKYDKFFLKKILVGQAESSFSHTGVSFHGGGYTPMFLDSVDVLPYDRPFASYMYFGYFLETASLKNDLFIKSEIALGWIGPWALGKETQVFIHRGIGSAIPLGWDNQVRTDLVIQYSIDFDKVLFFIRKIPILWWETKIDIGTMRDNATIGFKIDGEPMQYIFQKQEKKFFFSPFAGLSVTAIGYDALMQGGLFNHSSPLVFSSGKIEGLVIKSKVGIKAGFKKLKIGFSMVYISPEFKGGLSHSWGNVDLEIKF